MCIVFRKEYSISKGMSCRICFEKDEKTSKLISPCHCKGSSLFVHCHCLEQWQNLSLASNKPKKAFTCTICCSPFTYPSWYSLLKRRIKYTIVYYTNLLMIIFSLTWISFIIVPMKLCYHVSMFLLSIVLPAGNFTLIGGLQLSWVGLFPPRLTLSRTGEPIPEIYGGGVVLVASKLIPRSSKFYKSVIVLVGHNELGSKGVIVNIDSDTLGPHATQVHKDELLTIGSGGPLDTSQYCIIHDCSECSTHSDRITPKLLTSTINRNIFPLVFRNSSDACQKPFYFAEYVGAISVIQDITSIIISQRKVLKEVKTSGSIRKSLSSSILSYIGDWQQTDQDLKQDPDVQPTDLTRVRILRGHSRWKPKQLDGEIRAGEWFVVPIQRDFIFSTSTDRKHLWHNMISQIETARLN